VAVVNIYRVYAISVIYALWMLRNKLFYLYLTILLPFTILVPLRIIAPARLEPFIAVGTVILTLIYCFSTASQDLAVDRLLKRIAILLTKPVTPLEYFLGVLLSNAMQTLPATVIVIIVLWIVGLIEIKDIALLLLGLVAGWYILTIMGYITALALLSRDYNTIVIVSNSVSFIITFMAPVYYPLELFPEQLRILAYLIPTTHIANIIGEACNIEYGVPLTITYVYLLVIAFLLTIIAAKSLKLKDIY
jgi:ABC-2 type transport system permease protein